MTATQGRSIFVAPLMLSNKDGKKSVIDGQQRLTSLTILLIYLNNLQKDQPKKVGIDTLIYSELYDQKSFNLDVPERQHCLEALYSEGDYEIQEDDEESVQNISDRFYDVATFFPDALKGKALPYFIDWLINNVVMVVITAYSDDNAYTIFETMNDRGLNLTPSEMLKGYLLSRLNKTQRNSIDDLWKSEKNEKSTQDEMLSRDVSEMPSRCCPSTRSGPSSAKLLKPGSGLPYLSSTSQNSPQTSTRLFEQALVILVTKAYEPLKNS